VEPDPVVVMPTTAPSTTAPESTSETAAQPESVKIVVEGPMTGDQSATGLDMWHSAQLAVEDAGGTVLGLPIELVQADDAADAAKGIELAQANAADSFALIGPYNSSVGIENLPLWIDGGALPMHLTSNNATDGLGFTLQPKNNQIAPIEAKAMAELLKVKSVAIVYDDSAYTAGMAEDVKAELEAAGVDVVLFESFPEGQLDAPTLASAVVDAKPDLYYLSTYFPQGGELAKAIAPQTEANCFAGLANQDAGFVEAAGLEVARSCLSSGLPSAEQFPAAKDYLAAFQAAQGKVPGPMGPFAYDSVRLLLDAIERVGSLDRAKVEQEIAGTQAWQGITGPVTIDPQTGNRSDVPVVVLDVTPEGSFVINPEWASFAGFGD
jgi:ABC-type branched-subunit amino acid transport system substrate-binding protein